MNTKTSVIAKIEIKFPQGAKTIDFALKSKHDIENCRDGAIIVVNLIDCQCITGIFKGMSDDDFKIKSISGKHTLGYDKKYISEYYEEIAQPPLY